MFSVDNDVFKWFTFLYFDQLNNEDYPGEDELRLARKVMRELYDIGRRPLPAFFSLEPVEKLLDPGRKDWQDFLFGLHKTNARHQGKKTLVTFSRDTQPWEINDYLSYLPQAVKHRRRDNTAIIDNSKEFERWLGQPPAAKMLSSCSKGHQRS